MTANNSFGLIVQSENQLDQMLLLGEVAGIRNGDQWFTLSDIRELYGDLRIPPPTNMNQVVAALERKKQLLRDRPSPRISLTPLGKHAAAQIRETLDITNLRRIEIATTGTDFADGKHTVVPPSFAPLRWQASLEGFLERYPFETNVFLMTRFPAKERNPSDPIVSRIEEIRNVCASHGLDLHLASDRQTEDEIFGNVGAYMWACQFGIGLLETHGLDQNGDPIESLNDNVLIELGAMLMTGRRCALLKDKAAPNMPSDLAAQIYKTVDFTQSLSVEKAVTDWITNDLGL